MSLFKLNSDVNNPLGAGINETSGFFFCPLTNLGSNLKRFNFSPKNPGCLTSMDHSADNDDRSCLQSVVSIYLAQQLYIMGKWEEPLSIIPDSFLKRAINAAFQNIWFWSQEFESFSHEAWQWLNSHVTYEYPSNEIVTPAGQPEALLLVIQLVCGWILIKY